MDIYPQTFLVIGNQKLILGICLDLTLIALNKLCNLWAQDASTKASEHALQPRELRVKMKHQYLTIIAFKCNKKLHILKYLFNKNYITFGIPGLTLFIFSPVLPNL
ncbi:hypothetical protein J6590_020870 [Homalodisca vitripennis]|nr:hypothetical protein J6590_020870 [Homalodisca vitripennis]